MMTRIRHEFPHKLKLIEHCFIPMRDGLRLAAKIWLPEDAEAKPVPAILEYLPYRKSDHMLERDQPMHAYFAGFGYASLRVDLRGSGDSEGILEDEYTQQEFDDALDILNWLERQPWCTGKVGMYGISWGGFNALQIAALRPRQLKAIITLCSTDDRYDNDVHYTGGCLNACDALAWGGFMHMAQARPPDPLYHENWREMWLERLEKTPNFLETWLSHQRRDDYWKHGSVCEDYGRIECAVYSVQGWADAYVTSTPRFLAELSCPKKALIGPWAHAFPHYGEPGPTIGFLQEALRWWDYWLKGMDTGIMAEPMLRVWLQEWVKPASYHAKRPGRWVAEEIWPSPRIKDQQLFLGQGTLQSRPAGSEKLSIKGSQLYGKDAGIWCPYGNPGDFPVDQRQEDALALCFETDKAQDIQEILGFPELKLELSSDKPLALLSVRLCDVAPNGESLLVTRGALNLTHRNSHEFPERLEPHKQYKISLKLDAVAHQLAKGHRWRLALSPTYWNHLWPSPEAVTLSVYLGEHSYLNLPIRPLRPEDKTLAPFAEAEMAAAPDVVTSGGNLHREHHVDVITQTHSFTDFSDEGVTQIMTNGLLFGGKIKNFYRIQEGKPLSAYQQINNTFFLKRDDWHIRIESSNTLTSNETDFILNSQLDAYEAEVRIFNRSKTLKIPRDFI